jgi:hypothetical protein
LFFAYKTFRPNNALNTNRNDEIQEQDDDDFTDFEEIE